MGFSDFSNYAQQRYKIALIQVVKEASAKKLHQYTDLSNYASLDSLKNIGAMPVEEKDPFLVFLMSEIKLSWSQKGKYSYSRDEAWFHGFKVLEYILKNHEPAMITLQKIAEGLKQLRDKDLAPYYIPTLKILTHIRKAVLKHGLTPGMRSALQALMYAPDPFLPRDQNKENDMLAFLLQDDTSVEVSQHDRWGKAVIAYINSLDPELRAAWIALFAHAKSAGSKSTPTARWLKQAQVLLENIGYSAFFLRLEEWLNFLQTILREIHKDETTDFLRNENHDIIKGLIWCVGLVNHPTLNTALDEYAVWAYKKKPGVGSLSVKTGTAAMFAFSLLPVKEGVSRLSKFRTRIKNNSILKAIDKIIKATSKQHGMRMSEMEEMAVPDFGISNHAIELSLAEGILRYNITEGELRWDRGDKVQKAIPAEIKRSYSAQIKALKNTIKEIDATLPVIKARLENSYLQQRVWNFENWKKLYIDHPLTSLMATKLIWHFSNEQQKDQGILMGDNFVNGNGDPIRWIDNTTTVQLWHPIGFSADYILQWRTVLTRHGIIQPFKQAYREVYIITDAELRTEVYSNRFAAHILRQHQFAALLRQRGWHYTIMGAWDSHNTPYINLPTWQLVAEYFVNADYQAAETNAMGIYNYVTTDQVRFVRQGQTLALRDVPALVFSEIMRDVDLFVGVTSIGNDAAWQDGGNNLQNTYWREYSFSDLTESARVRSQVLQSLIPSLKIAALCSFDKKFLIVKGKLKTYKIHMGSGNILMEPDDRYLCIVPEGRKDNLRGEKIFLPFEGDTLLSIIISKAFLLADDDKITDVTITRQIK